MSGQPQASVETSIALEQKATENDSMLKSWTVARLDSLAQLRSEGINPEDAPHLPYVGLEHMDPGNTRLSRWGQTSSVRSSKSHFYSNDVLYGKLRPYLDKAVLSEREGICSTDILVLSPKAQVDPAFLSYLLHLRYFVNHAIATTTGVNHPRTSWASIREFETQLPPLKEQKAIAHVLSTVQRAIGTTEQVIEATRELKRSLMDHLFTYGPVPVDEAEQVPLKETEIGSVPEQWRVLPIGDIAKVRRGASPRPKGDPRYFSQSGSVHWIKISDLRKYKRGKYLENTNEYLTEEGRDKSYFTPQGTLLLTNSGTVGIPTILGIDGCIHDGYLALLDPQVDNQFIYYFLEHSRKRLKQLAPKGTQANLNTTIVKNFPLPVPPADEQREVVNGLSVVDEKITAEENRKQALQVLSEILLRNLMTGKVRVKDLDLSEVEEMV